MTAIEFFSCDILMDHGNVKLAWAISPSNCNVKCNAVLWARADAINHLKKLNLHPYKSVEYIKMETKICLSDIGKKYKPYQFELNFETS